MTDRKYKWGKIYKIVDIGYNLCYIGSTTQDLSRRMSQHRANYKRHLKMSGAANVSVYKIFQEYDIANCKIELIEYCACSSRLELESREGHYIKNNVCVNKIVPGFHEEKAAINKIKAKEYYESRKHDPDVIKKKCEYALKYKEDLRKWKEINAGKGRNYMPGAERPSFIEQKLQKAKEYAKKISLILEMKNE